MSASGRIPARRGSGRSGPMRTTPAWSRRPAAGRTSWWISAAAEQAAHEGGGPLAQPLDLLLAVVGEQRRVLRADLEGARGAAHIARAAEVRADRRAHGVAPSAGGTRERGDEARRVHAVDDVLAPRAQQLLRRRVLGAAKQQHGNVVVELEGDVVVAGLLGVLPAEIVERLEVDLVEVRQQGPLRLALRGVDEGRADLGFGKGEHRKSWHAEVEGGRDEVTPSRPRGPPRFLHAARACSSPSPWWTRQRYTRRARPGNGDDCRVTR